MAGTTWSQDVFSKGELSPLMYSRITADPFYKGLKVAANCITYPQGAIGKRFGTLYINEVSGATSYENYKFEAFEYLTQCTYLLVFYPDNVSVYLEGNLVATITSTGYTAGEIEYLNTSVIEDQFAICSRQLRPKIIRRGENASNLIAGFTSTTLTLTTPETAGWILPVAFVGASLPACSTPLSENTIYFAKFLSTTSVEIYSTIQDAVSSANKFTFTSAGTTANLRSQNTWTITNISFKNFPGYDFTNNYSTYTFDLSAASGQVTLTSSTALFTPDYINGGFIFASGSTRGEAKIVAVAAGGPHTTCTVFITQTFPAIADLPGRLCQVLEPAWSDKRGWPTVVSSFQNRAIFANTRSLTNGLWLSYTNSYSDFDDTGTDDDSAISYYPSSNTVNAIRFIVPYRSLTIHTNTGIYSTPLSFETGITPRNFSLQLQESTPATAVQPRGIDNQIVIASGNDIHGMLWDGISNAYASNIVSVGSDHLIDDPIDEVAYTDLSRAGSRYVFFVNRNGTLVIFQTLINQDVQGFTPASFYQSYGDAYFRYGTSDSLGNCWFLTERYIAQLAATEVIASVNTTLNTLTTTNPHSIGTTPTLIQFDFTGGDVTGSPSLVPASWYYAIAIDTTTFKIYLSEENALANEPINITGLTGAPEVKSYPPTQKFYIEKLSFDVFTDCSSTYSGTATSTFTNEPRFLGQDIKINGDGFGFIATPTTNDIEVLAHGQPVEVSEAFYGFPIRTEIQPLPLSVVSGRTYKTSSLVFPTHIRYVVAYFQHTIGGTINGRPIKLKTLLENIPGEPPQYQTGIAELSIMKGWDNLQRNLISIVHDDPYDIRLIGLFYEVEVS